MQHSLQPIFSLKFVCLFFFQSPMFDGKVPHWYHFQCFFIKQRPKTVGDIAHFDSLRYDDQEKIKAKIGKFSFSSIKQLYFILRLTFTLVMK